MKVGLEPGCHKDMCWIMLVGNSKNRKEQRIADYDVRDAKISVKDYGGYSNDFSAIIMAIMDMRWLA